MSSITQNIAVIVPAHNEALSIGKVLSELNALQHPVTGLQLLTQVVVTDNGSQDDTAEIALAAGAQVINEQRLGYGYACLAALDYLHKQTNPPDVVVFVDGDHSVLCEELFSLVEPINEGYDLVVGCRTGRLQEQGALGIHQQFGNRLASALIRLFWQQPVNDLGPFRAIRHSALMALNMQDKRFGWTVEMQVKAIQVGLRYTEVPVSTLRRIGVSKISGTVRGTIGAAMGIFGTIFRLYLRQSTFLAAFKQAHYTNSQ